MAAYVIADVDVKDPGAYEEYKKGVPTSIAAYGGKFLVRGGPHEVLEGKWKPIRLVVLEFPSVDHVRRWYASEEYRTLKAIRVKNVVSDLVLVEGL
jgi:uncharacterized protein (DUF1330 family)